MDLAEPRAPFPDDAALPSVTVIVACRNERAHITACLDSLLDSDYPRHHLEILVVDGMSDDGTRAMVTEYARDHPEVRLVDNPRRITPAAFNVGVTAARGDVIAIVGAHAAYDRRYLRELVRHLVAYGADQAGAVAEYIARRDTPLGRAIAAASRHPLGAGANVGYKVGADRPKWVDTVSSGCYRRDVFQRVGPFDERLVFSQDIDFNTRLRRLGGRILLVPTARIRYFTRSDLRSFARHSFRNGEWVVVPLAYTRRMTMSWRHFVPMAFVGAVVAGGLLALIGFPPAKWGLIALAGFYAVTLGWAGVSTALRAGRVEYTLTLPAAIALLHATYGLGSWWGAARLVRARLGGGSGEAPGSTAATHSTPPPTSPLGPSPAERGDRQR